MSKETTYKFHVAMFNSNNKNTKLIGSMHNYYMYLN